jgi:hypothetical protein
LALGLDCSAAFVAAFVLLRRSQAPPLLQVLWCVLVLTLTLVSTRATAMARDRLLLKR